MASQLIVPALQNLAGAFNNAVDAARKDLEGYADIFEFLKLEVEKPMNERRNVFHLFKCAVFGQAEVMKKLQVSNQAELEKLWEEHLANPGVKQAVDALKDAEKKWLAFVEEVEEKLVPEEDKLTTNPPASVGQQLHNDLCVIYGLSGSPESLEAVCKGAKYTLFMYVRHLG